MSALLMVPASGTERLIQKVESQRRSSSPIKRSDLNALTRTRSARSTHSKHSIFTLSSSLRGSRSHKPGQFDAKKLKAFDEQLDTPYEKKSMEYDYKFDVIAAKVWNHPQNEAFNAIHKNDERFISPETINTLRYTYFERFEESYGKIATSLSQLPKPEYWSKVWDYDAYNHCHLFGASCKKNLIVVDQALVKKNAKTRRNTEKAFKEGTKVEDFEEEPDKETCIRDLWHTQSFWRDVYYDARSSTTNEDFDEWLPPVDIVQRFFITLTDYALYNLHVLECKVTEEDLENMSDAEISTLAGQFFFYFNDSDYAFFDVLAKVFNETFMQLIRTFILEEDKVAEKTKEVMNVLVETICSNFQINYFGGQGVDTILLVWHDFLLLALEKLVIANVPVLRAELTTTATTTEEKPLPEAPKAPATNTVAAKETAKSDKKVKSSRRRHGFFARFRK